MTHCVKINGTLVRFQQASYLAVLKTLKPMESLFITLGVRNFINSYPPGQNGRHSGRRHFQIHFLNENGLIPIQISLKFVPRSSIDNKAALVQVMAWRRTLMRHKGEMAHRAHWPLGDVVVMLNVFTASVQEHSL